MKDPTLPTPALLPCPFCGGEARVYPRTCDKETPYNPADRAFPIVRCGKCGAEAIGDDWKSEATAIEKWNTRAALSRHHEDGGRAAIPEYGTKWISVTEMVPATPHRDDSPIPGLPRATATLTSDPVLVWCGYPAVTTFVRGEGSGDGDFFARSSVTHWRPIQSPGNVVALGGEKGEAVAHGSGSPLDGLADKYGTRWGAPDEMGWSFEQHAFQDFCAEFAAAIRSAS